jgi:predicted Zn-dependent protease
MKQTEMYLTSGLGALAILLVIALITLSQANQGLTKSLQQQQEVINRGTIISQQVGQPVLRDMATVSLQNEKMKELLARHGFNVTKNPNPAQ